MIMLLTFDVGRNILSVITEARLLFDSFQGMENPNKTALKVKQTKATV